MPKQKMREKTIRAAPDTADGRGLIAIGPGPKMQKIRENNEKDRDKRIRIRG